MPIDVVAEVLANARLSPDYNVVTLGAPDIARLAKPGQFVMIRPAIGLDPLLRRPFSIFEIARDGQGTPALAHVPAHRPVREVPGPTLRHRHSSRRRR